MAKRLPDTHDSMKWIHDEFRKLVAKYPDPREAELVQHELYDRFADDPQAQLKMASVALDHAWSQRLALSSKDVEEPLARLMKESPDPSLPRERKRILAEVLDLFPDHKAAGAAGTELIKILSKRAYDMMLKKPGGSKKKAKKKKK